jgi:hypothetical protein
MDRIFREPGFMHGHVVDFFQLPHFAIFNVADICITSAAVLIMILAVVKNVGIDGEHYGRTGAPAGAPAAADSPAADPDPDPDSDATVSGATLSGATVSDSAVSDGPVTDSAAPGTSVTESAVSEAPESDRVEVDADPVERSDREL